jgi:DNA polymerase II small subunit
MDPHSFFIKHGIRLSLKAGELLKEKSEKEWEALLELGKVFIREEDVKRAFENKEKKIVVRRGEERTIAQEYDADIELIHTKDVTGKSRGKGKVDDFVTFFRDRYKKIRRLFPSTNAKYSTINAKELKKEEGQEIRLIGMIYDIRETKSGNILVELEDLTGKALAIIPKSNEKEFEKAKLLIRDEVVAFSGRVRNGFLVVDEFDWPDLPLRSTPNTGRRGLDLACVYLSDLHIGSKQCLWKYINHFIKWLNGETSEKKLYKKVKYVMIAGDVVDGIGIYPGQEEDLEELDIEKQYALFDEFVNSLPDYLEVIVAPGNHDAVRRAEPMPAISKELIKTDVHLVGNPSHMKIEGLYHIMYHGTSLDSMIANIPTLNYAHPEKVMVEYLKRRHLSPIYGGNLIVPEFVDYFVIDDVPDVLHCGHIHKNGYALYRGVHVINSGTFQDQTDYQKKQGHIPTPGLIGYLDIKTSTYTTINLCVI